jgi:hypothetical protein
VTERALLALLVMGLIWATVCARPALSAAADWLVQHPRPASSAVLVTGATVGVPAFVLGVYAVALAALSFAAVGALMRTLV